MSTLDMTKIFDNFSQSVFEIETQKDFKAHTNFAFLLIESNSISQLICNKLSFIQIKNEIIENDILQIRSKSSRKGIFRALRELLETIPPTYIEFLANGNSDLRRYTLLFLNLRLNRLLRDVTSELLIDRLQSLNPTLDHKIFKAFFEQKRDQESVLSGWSDSTYQKACSNTILILVRSGLLTPSKNKKTYEIQVMPLPFQLKQQLLLDGLESYVKLMLN